jgi:hypothetical protein
MTQLAQQQQALVAALWTPRTRDGLSLLAAHVAPLTQATRGLQAYRSNGRMLAERVLQGAYPVVAQLVGDENFAAMARALWLAAPPASGDMGTWGAAFAGWIDADASLSAEEPYLADVARVEWALHTVATAADAATDIASFALLQQVDPERITLALAPETWHLASRAPVASIVLAHLQGEPSLEEAGQRLRAGAAEDVLVWRAGWAPRARAMDHDECAFIGALLAGASLAVACDAAPALAVDQWLAPAVQSGLVTAAVPIAS